MNPTVFSELLTDISDEYIVSAANPRSKPVRWYHIPAAAACIVLLLTAVIYPKLKIRPPAVQPPAESITQESTADTEATETVTTQTAPSAFGKTDTVPTNSVTETSSAKMTDTESVSVIVTEQTQTTSAVTTPFPAGTESTNSVAASTTTQTTTSTTTMMTTTSPITTSHMAVRVPLWKGIIEHPESAPVDPKPNIYGTFKICPSDANDVLRKQYGIPTGFDLTQHQCLLIILDAYICQDAAVIDCSLSNNGLHLQIACLENTHPENSIIHYALPIPDDLAIKPETCTANYLILTDETQYQALVTNSLTIEIQEQEGLQ